MFISFIDEKNVIEFKQTFFLLIIQDRRAIDEILNSLLHQRRLQKMLLNQIFFAVFSTFIV